MRLKYCDVLFNHVISKDGDFHLVVTFSAFFFFFSFLFFMTNLQ